jgi:Cu/Ag efflux protein CusF
MSRSFTFVAALATLSVIGLGAAEARSQGDKPLATKQNKVTATVTVKAIDPATRSVTLRAENGNEDTFTVGPEVARFDQLKVGDTIRATYVESLVFQVRKPGAAAPPIDAVLAGGRLKDTPGGAIAVQETKAVTVKSVDMHAPSLTVTTADGRTLTRKVSDKTTLAGVKAGDQIDITYTQGLLVAAESPEK